MNIKGLKSVVAFFGFALLCDFAAHAARAQAPTNPPATGSEAPKLAEEQFKNIQALKGVPAEQVVPAMQFIAASLGVECDYCHVERAFEKDDKKTKVTARKMINMMMAINKENFEGHRDVTCYSCHRGAAEPVAIPMVSEEELKPEEAKKPGEAKLVMPAGEELLDKYLNAIGGAAALQKINSRVQKGTLTAFGGKNFSMEVISKAPGKRYSVMHLPNGDSITAFDGKSGWLSVPGRVHIMTAAENDGARIDADLYFATHLKSLYQKFNVLPGETISGHETYLVVGRAEGKPPLRLYLDKVSGLLLRLVRYAETPLGRIPTQLDYSDYRDADGVKVPFKWVLSRPGNHFSIQVDQIQQNVPVNDAKFVAPQPPPMPPKPANP